jgi:diguanylate cyclase (GGDEF)-like protein/excisionase family DNA binding protein
MEPIEWPGAEGVPTTARTRNGDERSLISVAQAATLLGVHPNTVRTWTDSGRLPAYRINARGDRRFRRGDVERLLAEGAVSEEAAANPDPSQRDHELTVLGRLAQGASGPNPVAVCRVAIDALRTQLGYPQVAIYLTGREGLRLETHAGYDIAPASIRESSALLEAETPSESGPDSQAITEVELVLRAGADPLGLLVIADPTGTSLSSAQLPFLRTVAGALGVAVHNARLLSRARREVTRSRALRAVTQELTGQLDLAAVLDDIVDRTRVLFEAEKAGLWLVVDGGRPFQLAASRGIGDTFQARVRSLTLQSATVGVRAVRERRTFVVQHAGNQSVAGEMSATYAAEGIETACLVPLVSHDRAVGILGLYHTRDREWPEEELTLVQSFANQAAVAISNARLYRSVAEQAARMRSIQDLSSRLNRLTDVQAIAEAIVAEASALAEYHDIRIYTVDWEQGTCEPIAFTDRLLGEGDFRERLRVEIGPGSFTGMVAETGEPMLINDALADDRGHTIDGTDDIDESMLVVPMLYEGRAVGVVALSKLGINQFSTDDLATMSIFAGYAAQAIANARSYERLEVQSGELARQLQSQRRLLEINEKLLSTFDQASVLELIADGLRSVVSYDNLSIYRADHVKRIFVPVLTRERHAAEVAAYIIPFGRGLMGWALDHGEPVLANDALEDPRALQIPGTPADPEALCVVPLINDGEAIGSMNIGRIGREEAYFSDTDFELIKLFAGQASIALRNAEAHQAVSIRAETDALTGLGNHGAFQRYLADLLEHADPDAENAPHIGLLMMDLDRFKDYNDRLGHPAGDALLQAIGTAISSAARTGDRVFRYGGDELALVLRDVDAPDAAVVGDRIRRAVARLSAAESTPVTITVGAAAFPADAPDKNALISAADTALYHGKRSGENRVVRFADVPNEMRDLRGTLDQLARAALMHPEEAGAVEDLVEKAARLGGAADVPSDDETRNVLLTVVRSLDPGKAMSRHADRVGRLAAEMAERLGCTAEETEVIELAGRLHEVAALGRSELGGIRSLREVGEVIAGVRQLAEGRPRRRLRASTSLATEVVSAANAYDELAQAPSIRRRRRFGEAVAEVKAANPHLRGEVLEALEFVVAPTPERIPARRRRTDPPAVAGAA